MEDRSDLGNRVPRETDLARDPDVGEPEIRRKRVLDPGDGDGPSVRRQRKVDQHSDRS